MSVITSSSSSSLPLSFFDLQGSKSACHLMRLSRLFYLPSTAVDNIDNQYNDGDGNSRNRIILQAMTSVIADCGLLGVRQMHRIIAFGRERTTLRNQQQTLSSSIPPVAELVSTENFRLQLSDQ
jgi:hypothetical protein